MRRPLAAAAAVAIACGVAAPARAQTTDFSGRPVQAVSFESEGRPLVDPRLSALVETPIGQPLRLAQVRESIAHLFSLGRFEDVRVHAESRADGVALRYELQPLHRAGAIVFARASGDGIDSGRLKRAVAERFGAAPQPGRAADIAAFIEEQLALVGYFHATVSGRTIPGAANRSTLRFDVQPGVRTRIGTVLVDGDPLIPQAEFLRALGLVRGQPFQRDAIGVRIDHYVQQQRSRGYYAMRVSLAPELQDEDRLANLTVNVIPGPRTRVEFSGDPLPPDQRDELVPIAREGSTDEDLLEDSSNRIESYFRGLGYRDATAPHVVENQGPDQVITFAVKRGPLYRVGPIEIAGNTSMSLAALQAPLRVKTGQPFSAAALDADLNLIADAYRREGFASVEATLSTETAPLTLETEDVSIGVRITIVEHERTLVTGVVFDGNRTIADTELRAEVGLQPGRPFFLTQMALDRDAIELHYANLGFPAAVVTGAPQINAAGTEAVVTYTISEGQRVFIDHVLIVGNERIREDTIAKELQFKEGDPLGLAAVNESQRRLTALGLFRRVRIAALDHGDSSRRDLLVSVDEAPLTTLWYGGGFEVRPALSDEDRTVAAQRLEFAPRASFEIGRRNLFGRNRSVNLFTSGSLVPNKADAEGTVAAGGGYDAFPEYRVLGQLREPRIGGSSADFRITGTLEQQSRTSFDFARRSASVELGGRATRTVSVSGGYQIQRSSVFNQTVDETEQRRIDRVLPQVRLSFFSSSIIRDTRDDAVNPGAGRYLSANAELAARAIGSEVGFAKSFFSAQTFHTVSERRIVLAAAGRVGLATAFVGANVFEDEDDLPASERFYAGGDTTVRGFALDQLGVRHSPPLPSDTLDSSNFPLGGNGLIILNGEVRVPLKGSFGAVGFLDAGNVFKSASDIDLAELRAAVGFGIRYRSPIGPIRVDIGFKLQRHDIGDGSREPLTAVHISLGQAF